MTRKRWVTSILVLVGLVVLTCAGGILWLVTADLRPLVEDYASKTLERRVTIAMFRVGWGNPLSLEVKGLRVANAPWASEPDMVTIEGISAKIDPWSLFGGDLRFQNLDVVKPTIVLERSPEGVGNWKFNGAGSATPTPAGAAPKNRTQFPTLLDLRLHDAKVSYRGRSGSWLRIDLHEAAIRSGGEDQPVTLIADGAYNDIPAKFSGETQSFAVLRDRSRPLGARFSVAAASATVDFTGTLMDPLDFDGAKGAIKIDAAKLDDFLKIFDAQIGVNPPLLLAGSFQRDGDNWQISDAHGKIAGNAFDGAIALAEEGRGEPDDVSMTLRFADLDIDRLMPTPGKLRARKIADYDAVSIRLDAKRSTNIDASVDAKRLTYATTHMSDVGVHFKLAPGEASFSRLTFAFAGGTVDASGSAVSVGQGTHIVTRGALSGADAAQLSRFVDALAGKIDGRVDGAFTMDMTGDTLGHALKADHGHEVLGMTDGRVARDLMEKLSTNLLNLFRNGVGSVQVACLLGIVDLRGGVATISPLRMRAQDGTLVGGGQIDLLRGHLDITIQTESATTGFFALDIPIRISGNFANPNIDPQFGIFTTSRQALTNNNPTHDLPPELRTLAERNACLH